MARRELEIRDLALSPVPNTTAHGEGSVRYGDEGFEVGWTMFPEGGIAGFEPISSLRKDLQAIVEQAAEFGTELIFLTYPADTIFYGWANIYTREVAAATGTLLIDTAAKLRPRCPPPPGSTFLKGPGAACDELFPDQHPTVLGHQQVADMMVEAMQGLE
jgi:hypothetical protein